jgi:c-di-GMP-binding flagellar brake protein YcgR
MFAVSEVRVMSPAERRWKRYKVDIRVRLRRWQEPEEAAQVMRSYELSLGGMSVYTPGKLEIGTWVLVVFALTAEGAALRLRAVVRNQRGFRCGLEFAELKAGERAEIAAYLEALGGAAGQ